VYFNYYYNKVGEVEVWKDEDERERREGRREGRSEGINNSLYIYVSSNLVI